MKCPICSVSQTTTFFKKEQNILLICKECRHIFWDNTPSLIELMNYYSTDYSPDHNQLRLQLSNAEYYKSHIKELSIKSGISPKRSTILDFGSSYPILMIEAKKMGFLNLIGADWDERAREYGNDHGIQMIKPDEIETKIPNRSVDIIRFSHVLEHLVDPLMTLKLLVKKLKKGGMVYITQPNFPVFSWESPPNDIADTVWPEHLHFFSPISLMLMISKTGMTIHKLFTHQQPDKILSDYSSNIDILYSMNKLSTIKDKGDPFFGKNGNFPVYTGQNSVAFAFL